MRVCSLTMTTLLVVLLVGATVRLTRLITSDAIFEPLRSAIEKRLPVSYMMRCDWCISWWVGLAVFTFGQYAPETIVWIVSGALTASLAAGWSALLGAAVEVKVYSDDQ